MIQVGSYCEMGWFNHQLNLTKKHQKKGTISKKDISSSQAFHLPSVRILKGGGVIPLRFPKGVPNLPKRNP